MESGPGAKHGVNPPSSVQEDDIEKLYPCHEVALKRRSIAFLFGLLLSFAAFGWFASTSFVHLGETQARERIQQLAQSVAATLDPAQIGALSGDSSDAHTEAFARIRKQLATIHGTDKQLRFVYLLGKRNDKVVFLADAEPSNSPDYSAPGDPCDEASPELLQAFDNGHTFVEGPHSDRWGTWVSTHVPLRDPDTGQVLAIFGMDVGDKSWREEIRPYRWLGFELVAFLVLAGAAVAFHLKCEVEYANGLAREAQRSARAERELAKKHADLKMRESEIRSILDSTPDVIYRLDTRGKVVFVSEAIRRYGYTPEELVGRSMVEFVHPDDRDKAGRLLSERRTGYRSNKRFELRMFLAECARVDAEFHSVMVNSPRSFVVSAEGLYASETPRTDTFVGTQGVARDITERKLAERERARLEAAIEQAHDAIIITDSLGNFQYVNPAFERMTGYTRFEAIGKNANILRSGKHRDTLYEEMWKTLLRGGVWRGRISNRKKDGTLFEVETSVSPMRDASGNITHFVSVKRDITRETQLEEQLRQAQKMEAIGTLAGGIAQDFNNILGAVLGFTQLAINEVPKGEVQQYLAEVERACFRAMELVKQILTFSRQTEREPKPLNLSLLVKETLELLRGLLPPSVEIEHSLDGEQGGAHILGDAAQMQQVLMNLCTNAFHAMEDSGGTLTVTLTQGEAALETSPAELGLPPGKYVRLTVTDTGHGMDAITRQHIFEPYYTTKPLGKGTGMGLATVHGIVKSHGGAIRVQSEPGKGTEFVIHLPVGPAVESERRESPSLKSLPAGHGEHILLVDDELPILTANETLLTCMGYKVTAVSSPCDALERFKRDPAGFDVVITDHVMPKKTGTELARELQSIRNGVPVILTTGLKNGAVIEKARAAGIREVVGKPATIGELVLAVRNALNGAIGPPKKVI